jgi:hypothetical protein
VPAPSRGGWRTPPALGVRTPLPNRAPEEAIIVPARRPSEDPPREAPRSAWHLRPRLAGPPAVPRASTSPAAPLFLSCLSSLASRRSSPTPPLPHPPIKGPPVSSRVRAPSARPPLSSSPRARSTASSHYRPSTPSSSLDPSRAHTVACCPALPSLSQEFEPRRPRHRGSPEPPPAKPPPPIGSW